MYLNLSYFDLILGTVPKRLASLWFVRYCPLVFNIV